MSLALTALALFGTAKAQVDVTATTGTPSASYTTLGAAFTAINAGTHTGDIVIGISASTTETGACVLNGSGAGSASYNSIQLYPTADGVTISGPTVTGRGLIELNGADNVTIDGDNPNSGGTGRNLTITNTAANTVTYTSVVRVAVAASVVNSANSVTIRNCTINGSGTGLNLVGTSSTTGAVNNTYGIYAGGGASTSSATTAPSAIASLTTTVGAGGTMNNLTISNNSITACGRGVAVQGGATSVINALTVTNNVIGSSTAGNSTTVYSMGMTLQGFAAADVSGNTVQNIESYISTSLRGIDLGSISANGSGAVVQRNIVNGVFNQNTTTYGAWGINLALVAASNTTLQSNFVTNVRQDLSGGATLGGFEAVGVRLTAGGGYKLYHNSVNLSQMLAGTPNTGMVTAALLINGTARTNCDIRNNIFANTLAGGSSGVHASIVMASGGTSSMNLTLNNNAYFTGGSALNGIAYVGSLSTFSAANVYSAANFNASATTPATNLRAATSVLSTGGANDNASLASSSPAPFTSASDLHIPAATVTLMESAGAAVGVTNDIDGQAFGSLGTATAPDMGADEFAGTAPTCFPPTGIAVTAVTSSTASVNWTNNLSESYEYEVRTSGAAGSGATGLVASGPSAGGPVPLSLLAPNTLHTVYVRGICSGGTVQSTWSSGVNFTTLCVSATMPYNENFDGVTPVNLPACYTKQTVGGNPNGWFTVNDAVDLDLGYTGNVILYQYSSSAAADAWFFTPSFDLTAGVSYRLSYRYGNDGGGTYAERLNILYGTAANAASMTLPVFDHPSILNTTNALNIVDFIPATSGTYFLGFHAYSIADRDLLIVDDIKLDLTPPCIAPTLTVTNVTFNTADLTWTNNSSESYDYEVRSSGAAGSGATGLVASGNVAGGPVPVGGLTANVQYTAYLRGVCSSGTVQSDWSIPVTFSAYCIPPHSNVCGAGDITNVTLNTLSHNSTCGPLYNFYPTDTATTSLQQTLSYPLSVTTEEACIISVWVDWDHDQLFEASEWTQVTTSSTANTPATVNIAVPPTAPLGPTYMRIRSRQAGNTNGSGDACTSFGSGESEDYVFTVDPPPTCFAPTDVNVTNITSSSADINWTNNDAPMYEYEVRSSGAAGSGPVGLEATGVVAAGPVPVSLPTPLTAYAVYVRGVCDGGADLSSWSAATNFSSGCAGFTCNHVLRMYDLYGDGWNGATLQVTQNGVPVMSGVTMSELCGPDEVNVSLCTGATVGITLTNSGSFSTELLMEFVDASGAVLYSFRGTAGEDGSGDCTGLVYPTSANGVPAVGVEAFSGTVTCPACQPPAAVATIDNDCGLGQFNVDVNITDLGNGASVNLTYTVNAGTPVTAGPFTTGVQTIGPFATSDVVAVTLEHETSDDCNVSLGSFSASSILCNDACSGAITISCATPAVNGTTIGATLDADYPNCGDGYGTPTTQRGVWYKFVGDDSQVSITTCDPSGTGYDSRISVYSGACGAFTCVTSNDDMTPECTTPTLGFRSEVTFNAFSGTDYFVFVHGYQTGTTLSATGNFILNIDCAALCLPLPSNDVCGSATPLTIGATCTPTAGTTACATATTGNPSCFSAFATLPDVYYTFVADNDSAAVTITAGTASGIGIALNEGCGGTQVFCSTNAAGTTIVTGLTSGTTYAIRVLTPSSTTGTFDICLGPLPTPPANDECATAQSLTVHEADDCVFTTGSTLLSTPEAPSGSCMNPTFTPFPSNVYYSFVATGFTNTITMNFGGSLEDNVNFLVRDACGGAEMACVFATSGTTYPVSGLTVGATYYVQVNTYLSQGSFGICVAESDIVAPANDDCANAEEITVQPFDDCTPTNGTNVASSASGENPSCLNPDVILNDVFYSFTATDAVQMITLDHNATADGYGLSVYDACDGNELLCAFVDLDTDGQPVTMTGLTPESTYVVRVMSMSAQAGPFTLCITGPQPPDTLTCGDVYIDAGGPGGDPTADGTPDPGDYLVSSNAVTVICPEDAGDLAVVTFTAFSTESGYDPLYVFDGNSTSAPMISSGNGIPTATNIYGAGGWWGTTAPNNIAPNVVRASNPTGCLTFAFTSDPSWTALGWEATVSCFTPNNTCATSAPISCGNTYTGFTTDVAPSMPASCAFNGPASTGGQNWWTYTAAATEEVTLSTCGASDFDLRISVFTGTGCGDLACYTAVDNSPGCADGSAQLSFTAVSGNTYYIVVHGVDDEEGDYQMAVSCAPLCTPAAGNDDCASATTINPALIGTGVMDLQDNSCAHNDAPTSCSGADPVQGQWFIFNSGAYNHLMITCDDNGENPAYTATTLNYAIYSGACSGLGAADELACVVDAASYSTPLSVTPNTDYRLLVYNSGGVGVEGSFGLLVEHPATRDAEIVAITSPVAGVFCSTMIDPTVTLRNNGDVPLTSVQFVYDIDGGTPQTYNWTGNLAFQATASVTLPPITTSAGPHTLNIHTTLPNGGADEITANDAKSVSIDIAGESLVVSVRTDANGGQTTWQIYDSFFFLVAEGGPYTGQDNTVISTNACLPTTFGSCYSFFIFDSFGDGLCCANGNGYWELKTNGGATLLRDRFMATPDGEQSPAAAPAAPGYVNGHEFCLPAGPSNILADECGVFTNTLQSKVYTRAIPGVSQYQFEFSDPDAGWRRFITLPRNWVKLSEMQTSPLVPGTIYFARARADQGAAGLGDDHFGTGCELGLSPNVGCTGLIDDPSLPTHSCGVTRHFNTSEKVWAFPVTGATQYRFRFSNAGEGFTRYIDRPSYICQLGWFTAPLQVGVTYDVQVEVLVNTVWSGFCGPVCQVTIVAPGARPDQRMGDVQEGGVSMWPNPVGDGRVNLLINGLTEEQQHISVDVYDLFGKKVMAQQYENAGEVFNTILHVPSTVAKGVYLVNITINGTTTVQRLTVQ